MKPELLKKYSIFNGLTDSEIETFIEVSREKLIPADITFITEDEVGTSIYLLIEGDVKINMALTLSMQKSKTDAREKAIIGLNSSYHPFFGEMCLFNDDDRRTASIKTSTDCKLIKIDKKDLLEICESNPVIGHKVMKNLANKMCGDLIKSNKNVLKLTTAFSLVLER